jgi:hypothetical protein
MRLKPHQLTADKEETDAKEHLPKSGMAQTENENVSEDMFDGKVRT